MTAPVLKRPGQLPSVARLGFNDGWLLLAPTFLNLGVPVLVTDHAYVGDPYSFGLRPFGACDPKAPLPLTSLVISSYGELIAIRTRSTTEILASACLRDCTTLQLFATYRTAVLVIGSTYELESTWAALWTMFIGRAEITHQVGTCDHA